MTQPYTLGAPLESAVWRTVRERAIFECCKWDIQTEDHCTLFERPLMLRRAAWDELRKTAEMLAAEVTSAEAELLQRPDLHRELGLPRALRNVLAAANHPTASFCRILRFDFHHTDEGWKISEVNADVPGGFIEASGFTMLMAEQYPGCEPTSDPVAAIVACYLDSAARDGLQGRPAGNAVFRAPPQGAARPDADGESGSSAMVRGKSEHRLGKCARRGRRDIPFLSRRVVTKNRDSRTLVGAGRKRTHPDIESCERGFDPIKAVSAHLVENAHKHGTMAAAHAGERGGDARPIARSRVGDQAGLRESW
jgi:hypothetical protein